MAKINPLDDFDWEAFENAASSQSVEESNEETTDVPEHTVVSGTVISINKREVVVNIGYRNDGILPVTSLSEYDGIGILTLQKCFNLVLDYKPQPTLEF